jgi:potassium-transporting ATPase potassium-binding subunit
VFGVVLIAVAAPLGFWMARVFTTSRRRVLERGFLRLIRSDGEPQSWQAYTLSLLAFSTVSFGVLFMLLLAQGGLPFNPQGFSGVAPLLALHTAASYVSSTNWQFFAGEATMSDGTQMAGLAVQNFAAPAAGLAAFVAVIRGISHRKGPGLGNFWVDAFRAAVYVLLPLAAAAALVLVSQGVPQTLSPYATAGTLEGDEQTIARGPVATQVAIRHLGTNGGGFYNTNAATPFENPTGLTNMIELFLQLIVPVACVFMFGRMVGSLRQAGMVLAVMGAMAVIGVGVAVAAELHGSQVLRDAKLASTENLADKEVRFGVAGSAFFTSATTAGSGSGVDTGHDALTAIGGLVPLSNMFVGVIGGAGTGMLAMLIDILLAVWIAGLMIGRTPQFLGKSIGVHEIKLVVASLLVVPGTVLALTAISIGTGAGRASIFNPGAHGFTETLYAFVSQATNNGSAFAGFGFSDLQAWLGFAAMLAGRFAPLVLALALAGSLAGARVTPVSRGTLRTDTLTFAVTLFAVAVITSGLTLLPALALGPLAEALS